MRALKRSILNRVKRVSIKVIESEQATKILEKCLQYLEIGHPFNHIKRFQTAPHTVRHTENKKITKMVLATEKHKRLMKPIKEMLLVLMN